MKKLQNVEIEFSPEALKKGLRIVSEESCFFFEECSSRIYTRNILSNSPDLEKKVSECRNKSSHQKL